MNVNFLTIYNSRNYKSLLDQDETEILLPVIYNSRNYKSLLDLQQRFNSSCNIYNSRNYKSLLDPIPQRRELCGSTIVEIIRVFQTSLGDSLMMGKIYNSRNYKSLLDPCRCKDNIFILINKDLHNKKKIVINYPSFFDNGIIF